MNLGQEILFGSVNFSPETWYSREVNLSVLYVYSGINDYSREVNGPTWKFYRDKWITFNLPSLNSCRNIAKSTPACGRVSFSMFSTRRSLTWLLSDSGNSSILTAEVCMNYHQWGSTIPIRETDPLGTIVSPQSKLGYDPKVMPSSLPSRTNISPLS